MKVVDAPGIAPAVGGLLPVANVIETSDGVTQMQGIRYQRPPHTPVRRVPSNGAKTFDKQCDVTGTPFSIYIGAESSAFQRVGTEALTRELFGAGESTAVEAAVKEFVLDPVALDVTPTLGTAVTPQRALAILEQWAADNYLGRPTLHTNRFGAVMLDDMVSGAPLTTRQGTPVANAGGYDGVGPALHAPVLTLGATQAAGGTFVADDYFWVVTAITGVEESVISNEVTATLILNDAQVLNWTQVPLATGYKVYRGTATGVYPTLVATLGDVATYTDTGIAGTASPPPTEAAPVTAAADEAWLYVSGQINLWRTPLDVTGADVLLTGGRRALAERTYVATVDGPVAAVLMTL